ncbi:MAG: hypothetical protein LBI19_01355 [Oscillospiraceae bacterium]|nr:hypothetical protein [Oscillospiraceae bacterium]
MRNGEKKLRSQYRHNNIPAKANAKIVMYNETRKALSLPRLAASISSAAFVSSSTKILTAFSTEPLFIADRAALFMSIESGGHISPRKDSEIMIVLAIATATIKATILFIASPQKYNPHPVPF